MIVSRGNAMKDGFGQLVAGLPHDAIVRQREGKKAKNVKTKNNNLAYEFFY